MNKMYKCETMNKQIKSIPQGYVIMRMEKGYPAIFISGDKIIQTSPVMSKTVINGGKIIMIETAHTIYAKA